MYRYLGVHMAILYRYLNRDTCVDNVSIYLDVKIDNISINLCYFFLTTQKTKVRGNVICDTRRCQHRNRFINAFKDLINRYR